MMSRRFCWRIKEGRCKREEAGEVEKREGVRRGEGGERRVGLS